MFPVSQNDIELIVVALLSWALLTIDYTWSHFRLVKIWNLGLESTKLLVVGFETRFVGFETLAVRTPQTPCHDTASLGLSFLAFQATTHTEWKGYELECALENVWEMILIKLFRCYFNGRCRKERSFIPWCHHPCGVVALPWRKRFFGSTKAGCGFSKSHARKAEIKRWWRLRPRQVC